MARPPDPRRGTRARLESDWQRYSLVYCFVYARVAEGRTTDQAYEEAETTLRVQERRFSYDTAKKHYLRMRESIRAAKAAGVDVTTYEPSTSPGVPWTAVDAEDAAWIPLRLSPSSRAAMRESMFWDQVAEDPELLVADAFSAAERKPLTRLPRTLSLQLARERLELIQLRKQFVRMKSK